MGKPVDFALAAVKAVQTEKDPFAQTCTVLKCTGYASWLVIDMMQWLDAHGVVSVPSPALAALNALSPRLWLLGIASSLVLNLHRVQQVTLHRTRLSYAEAADPAADADLAAELRRLGRAVVQDTLDMAIPLTTMGYLPLSPGLVGAAGSVTSVLGAMAIYPSKAKTD